MALTTYVKGRAYDWSHAIGRASANGTGFNYPQTMCLGNDGDVYVANRGNENNFGMRVNHIKVGGPGEEELLAEFATYGEKDENCVWPFGVAVGKNGDVYVTDEWKSTVSVFDAKGKFVRKVLLEFAKRAQICGDRGRCRFVDKGRLQTAYSRRVDPKFIL